MQLTSGVAPAARTVATATEISAADKGSKGWLVWALTMLRIPICKHKKDKIFKQHNWREMQSNLSYNLRRKALW